MSRSGPGQLSVEIADSTAPRDPKRRGDHYRAHLAEAHTVIAAYRQRITELEAELVKVRRDREYDLSISVSRTAAEEARLSAFRLARGKASALAEGADGIPNNTSYAIDCIPDPRPKFTK